MNQIVNIFRKDTLHLWKEILTSLTFLVLFTIFEPKTWMNLQSSSIVLSGIGFSALLVISWGLLIIRLIQADRLAGLNQFWTTRPYEWQKLLCAKILFLLAFLYSPLFLSQVYLVHLGGFSILSCLPLLFRNLLPLTSSIILPMICVAMLTASFAQAMLSFLGITATIIALFSAFSFLGTISATLGMPRRPPLFLPSLQIGIETVFFFAIVLLQYRQRATRKSIFLLTATALLLIFVSVTLKGSAAAVKGYAYTVTDPPVSVSIDTSKSTAFTVVQPKNPRTAMYRIPLLFSNFAPETTISLEAQRYTLTASDGYTWTSDWINDNDDFGGIAPKVAGGAVHTRSFIDIPWRVHHRLGAGPILLRLEFLVSQLGNAKPYTYPLSTDMHSVPDIGICGFSDAKDGLICRTDYDQSRFSTINALTSPVPCDNATNLPNTQVLNPVAETGFLLGRMRTPQSLIPFISPVLANEVHFHSGTDQITGYLCPGTPITFAAKNYQRHLRLQTAAAIVTLKDAVSSTTK